MLFVVSLKGQWKTILNIYVIVISYSQSVDLYIIYKYAGRVILILKKSTINLDDHHNVKNHLARMQAKA